jgi:L-ascorbate metabolism protein UlaG (beta-lactamase superfamily)
MRITYVGHATVQIQDGSSRLLTDPVLRARVAHLKRIVPPPVIKDLDRPDGVLISHAHFDHLDAASLKLLHACPAIAPRGCGRLLRRAGFRDVTEAAAGERIAIAGMNVTPIRVAHDGRRHPLSLARATFGYLIEADTTAFFAGDTDVFDGMSELSGELDVALLPIWGWGPRVGKGHMDPVRAARAAGLLRPRIAIPVHWGTLASPRAPWRDDPRRPAGGFAEQVAAQTPGVEVRVLAPGERTDVV